LSGGNLVLEAVEEGDEVKAVARLGGHPRDLAGMHLKRREEVLGSVAHVLVVAPGGLGGRWGAVGAHEPLGLDSGLLVDRDDDRVLGRVEIETADLGGLRVEVGPKLGHHPVPVRWGRISPAARMRCAWDSERPTASPSSR